MAYRQWITLITFLVKWLPDRWLETGSRPLFLSQPSLSKGSQVSVGQLSKPDVSTSETSQSQPRSSPLRKLGSWDVLAPLLVGILFLILWDLFVRITETPPYLLPGPLLVFQTLLEEWPDLFPSLLITLKITVVAFAAAIVSGLLISILFTQSKWIERSFFPYAVVLQTTPIVAIAPLIIIWLRNNTFAAMVVCAWIVAFFPIISNTTLGLNSADHNLVNLFQLYKANRWQTLIHLRLPSAMPYFLGALRISGGLSLIGAVVAEFVAGTGGQRAGIAYQILISSFNLQVPRMFAALFLTSLLGIAIFVVMSLISDRLLRNWHESAVQREN